MSNTRARIAKLVAASATRTARTAAERRMHTRMDSTAKAARIIHMMAQADPLAPMTPSNQRACRVAILMYAAEDSANAAKARTT